jgi:hypothetical protein
MNTVITSTSEPAMVELRFSDVPVAYEFTGDVIAIVNRSGNWITGLELLGSGLQFSLQKALSALAPEPSAASVRHPQSTLLVTYDEDANAGFLYLPYASPASVEQDHQSNPLLLKSSYSVEDDQATFGLAADKTLVSVRFAVPDSERMENFMQLFGSRAE